MKKFFLFAFFTLFFHFAEAQPTGSGCNPHFTFTQNGLTLDFHAVVQNAGWGYVWSFGDSSSGNGANPSHTYANAGTYVVCLTVFDTADACSNTSCDTIGVWLGVHENIFISSLQLYPNPAQHQATLGYTLLSASHVKIELTDLLGNTVSVVSDEMEQAGDHQAIVYLRSRAPGIYFLRIITDDGAAVVRVVKESAED